MGDYADGKAWWPPGFKTAQELAVMADEERKVMVECPHEWVTSFPRYRECLICGRGRYMTDVS